MSDATAETASTDAPTTTEAPTETVDLAAEVEKWKAQARKNEERAKANAGAAKELEALRATTMSEQEKAVAAARDEGRAEALREAAVDLVDAALTAKAAGRLTAEQLEALTSNLDRTKFIGEDGRVAHDLVETFVNGIAPALQEQHPTTPPPPLDLGQGPRGAPLALNSDALSNALSRAVGAK